MWVHMKNPFKIRRKPRKFPELTYADPEYPRIKRWLIQSIEDISGRKRFADAYENWRNKDVPTGRNIFSAMLSHVNVKVAPQGHWPPKKLPEGPLVLIANHPFGIGDGMAMLALAEQLGRPFKVMINSVLMKLPEMEPYSLPVSFDETREALQTNIATRREAMKLLKDGTVIILFPAGGVATAPQGIGRAIDLPWKKFVARLVQQSGASVVPIYFEGQNGRLFHLASQVSSTLRTSLFIAELRRLGGKTLTARIGDTLSADELKLISDRQSLLDHLQQSVFRLQPPGKFRRFIPERLKDRKLSKKVIGDMHTRR